MDEDCGDLAECGKKATLFMIFLPHYMWAEKNKKANRTTKTTKPNKQDKLVKPRKQKRQAVPKKFHRVAKWHALMSETEDEEEGDRRRRTNSQPPIISAVAWEKQTEEPEDDI